MPKRVNKPKGLVPFWKGPKEDGLTQSLLGRFLNCRHRFYLKTILGLTEEEGFRVPIEYGNIWHECEEALAAGQNWNLKAKECAERLCREYPLEQEKVSHWYQVCVVQFPIYVKYWEKHKDTQARKNVASELAFKAPYVLPDGREVTLRGKFDSVDLIGKGKKAELYLQENKTKGDINEEQLVEQLTFDLQTMFYLVALRSLRLGGKHPTGIRYNVIRRPLSGGKGTIRQHKPSKAKPQGESAVDFYNRVKGVIEEDQDRYFMRWSVAIAPQELVAFEHQFLIPILTQLCDWWEWISADPANPFRGDANGTAGGGFHWRHPYGIYDPLARGGRTNLDEYLLNGSTIGLTKAKTLYPELDNANS